MCAAGHDVYGQVSLRCYRPDGKALALRRVSAPSAQRALFLRDGSLAISGHQRIVVDASERAAGVVAWLGRFTRDRSAWTHVSGAEGGFSTLDSLTETVDGAILAAGALTNEKGSKQQRPWIGKWSAQGELLWSETVPKLGTGSMVSAISAAEDGSVWASGQFEEASWLRHYDARGALLSESEVPSVHRVYSLLALQASVVVGSMAPAGPLRAYGPTGKLLWSVDRQGCSVERLERSSGGFVATWTCGDDLSIVAYDSR